jgi:hypothetical protein
MRRVTVGKRERRVAKRLTEANRENGHGKLEKDNGRAPGFRGAHLFVRRLQQEEKEVLDISEARDDGGWNNLFRR